MQQTGIKETREVIEAAMEMICLIVEKLKDGYQSDDIVEIVRALKDNPTFVSALADIHKAPEELSDIDLPEGLELAWMAVRFVPRLISAVKR